MSVTRACLQCRTAKAKCDLERPSCGRCTRRGLSCTGFPEDTGFIFRDENEIAERNSRRARRGGRDTGSRTTSYEVALRSTSSTRISDDELQLDFPWLNEQALSSLPEPLKRDVETRAVERFFINWILHPSRDGVSPGHMHDLPRLYYGATANSVLWFAVRAVAFADMKQLRDGDVPFDIKARSSYGAALQSMRAITDNEQELTQNNVLAALLLIDNFESIYLARIEPLGPHTDAIRHLLYARGSKQLYDKSQFNLWTIANSRLQARQILRHEKPDRSQLDLLSQLNSDRFDIHIATDICDMSSLTAAAHQLIQSDDDMAATEKIDEARNLAHTMQNTTATMESWTSTMCGMWMPKVIESAPLVNSPEVTDGAEHPLHHFPCPCFLGYQDVWLSFLWSFHAACQIVFRESLIAVVQYSARLQQQQQQSSQQASDSVDQQAVVKEKAAIERLSGSIMRSFPTLMGFTDSSATYRVPRVHGRMVGRHLALFALSVVQSAQFTSEVHKFTASKVIRWVIAQHALE